MNGVGVVDDGIELPTRSIRFGTYRCKPGGNIRFTSDKLNVIVFQDPKSRRDDTTYSISISYRHINHVQYFISDQAKANCVIFIVSSICADKIRAALGMRPESIKCDVRPNEPYFDPKRPEDCFRFIVVLLNGVEETIRDEFVDLFIKKVSVQKRERGQPFEFKEIEVHMAKELLIRTIPNQFKSDTDRSPDSSNRNSPCPPICTTATFNGRQPPLQSEQRAQSLTTPPRLHPQQHTPSYVRIQLQGEGAQQQSPTFTLIPIGPVLSGLTNNFVTPIIPRNTTVVPSREYPPPQYTRSPINAFGKSGQLNVQVSYQTSRQPISHTLSGVGPLVNSLRNDTSRPQNLNSGRPVIDTWNTGRTTLHRISKSKSTPIFSSQTVDLIEEDNKEEDAEESGPKAKLADGIILCYPPPPEKGGIQISGQDLPCLQEGEFINDSIIDFYLKYIVRELIGDLKDRVHLFNTFFWKRLVEGKVSRPAGGVGCPSPNLKQVKAENRHSLVKNWTKSVDIFDKDFVIIPINEMAHWFVVIVCFPGHDPPKEPVPVITKKVFQPPVKRNTVAARLINQARKEEMDCAEVLASLYGDIPPPEEKQDNGVDKGPASNSDAAGKSKKDGSPIKCLAANDSFQTSHKIELEGFPSVKGNVINEEYVVEKLETNNPNVDDIDGERVDKLEVEQGDDDSVAMDTEIAGPSTSHQAKPDSDGKQGYEDVPPLIIVFDSLSMHDAPRYKNSTILREYFSLEWKHKKPDKEARVFDKDSMKAFYPRVPQQDNWWDCGVFLLEYVERFLQNLPEPLNPPTKSLNKNWFDPAHVNTKREEIRKLICKLSGLPEEQFETKVAPIFKTEPEEQSNYNDEACQPPDMGGEITVKGGETSGMGEEGGTPRTANISRLSTSERVDAMIDEHKESKRRVTIMNDEEGLNPVNKRKRLVHSSYDDSGEA